VATTQPSSDFLSEFRVQAKATTTQVHPAASLTAEKPQSKHPFRGEPRTSGSTISKKIVPLRLCPLLNDLPPVNGAALLA
jgi:hypothetical protein